MIEPTRNERGFPRVLVFTCFFLSGAVALVFQLVWIRLLTQVFGSSTLAVSTVWSVFMAGLALGSGLGGRFVDRTRRDPLVVYAFCELGIAVLGLLVPVVVLEYPRLNAGLWAVLGDSTALLAVVRFALCALVLLPVTTLMGATLPVLARRLVNSSGELEQIGARVGGLYAINSLGAVIGVFASGFWLLEALGLRGLNGLAVGIALIIPATIGIAHRIGSLPRRETSGVREGARFAEANRPLTIDARRALVAFAVSGALAMVLEVLYFRSLALVLGSAIQSFTLVLVVFLSGLAGGAALLGRRVSRSGDPTGWLAIAFLGVGAAVAFAIWAIDELPDAYIALAAGEDVTTPAGVWIRLALVGVVLPTSFFLGAIMPLAVSIYRGSLDRVGQRVGEIYAANTVGAIVGSIAGGFLVLPLVGLRPGLLIVSGAFLGGALLLAGRAADDTRRRVVWAGAPALGVLLLFLPDWDADRLTSGPFRLRLSDEVRGGIRDAELVYYRDGLISTITVRRFSKSYVLYNNGKPDASSHGDRSTQIQLGLLPAALHPGRDLEVLVIGYGSGMTVGAVTRAGYVRRVDAVDIEPAVFEAADRYFAEYTHSPGTNPGVDRVVADGRDFLGSGSEPYDIIVSEPPNPWVAGVANLFSAEFYALALERLAPDGLFCQWVQVYDFTPETLKLVYRTFNSRFPYAIAVQPFGGDSILIGSREPILFRLEQLERRFRDPGFASEFARSMVNSPYDLLTELLLAPGEMDVFTGEGPVSTDDNALLEFAAQRDFLTGGDVADRTARSERIRESLARFGRLDDVVTEWGSGPVKRERQLELARALAARNKAVEAARWRAFAGESE